MPSWWRWQIMGQGDDHRTDYWRGTPRPVAPSTGLGTFLLKRTRHLVVCVRSLAGFVLHPFEFSAARDDSAVTLAPQGRQIVAQCVSTGNGVKDRRAPERGGRTGDECFFRPVPGLANLLYGLRARALGYSLSPSGLREHFLVAACRFAGRAILPNAT
jgi:hypothetical protein